MRLNEDEGIKYFIKLKILNRAKFFAEYNAKQRETIRFK